MRCSRFTRRTRQKAPDFDQEQTIFPNCECLLAIIPTGIQHYVNLCSLSIGTTERIGEVRLSIRIKSQCSDQGPPNRLSYTQYLSLDYSYQSVSVSISVTETPHILGRETKPHGCAGGLFLVRSTLMPGACITGVSARWHLVIEQHSTVSLVHSTSSTL